MVIFRQQIIEYWSSGPTVKPIPKGYICLANRLYFPDVVTLSPAEKEILRPVIERHPEYLEHEIDCLDLIQ